MSQLPKPRLTEQERGAIELLIEAASELWFILDNAECRPAEDGDGEELVIYKQLTESGEDALNALDELPNDKPNYVLGAAGKAQWALRRLIGDNP